MARATVSLRTFHSGEPGAASGRHRLHERNPAGCAAAAVGKKRTLVRLGVRAGQLGRLWRDYRALLVGQAAAATEQLPYEYDFSMRADDQRAEDQRDDDQPSITNELS